MKCPGQDSRYWTFDDIFDVTCLTCGTVIEFFKDDPVRICEKCNNQVTNPKLDEGCHKHCSSATECSLFK